MHFFKKYKFVDMILILFLILQPIFDLKIFYNSISTLIRTVVIICLFSYYFIKDKLEKNSVSSKKKKYILILYPLILFVFFIFHHLNTLNFTSFVPNNFDYSILKEALYFLKMLCPFLLIYSLFKSNIDKKDYFKIIKIIVLIISSIIIFSNLFMFSYGNYSDKIIKTNFFQWFNTDCSYLELASKGLFEYGNQISAVLIIFLPFIIISILDNNSKKEILFNSITLIFNVFALILLCTKVSVLGIFIVFLYTIFSFIFIKFLNKKRENNIEKNPKEFVKINCSIKHFAPIIIIFSIYALLLPINPMFNRTQERTSVIETFAEINPNNQTNQDIVAESITDINSNLETTDNPINTIPNSENANNNNDMAQYIENNYENKRIHKQFLFTNYPYKYDLEFWYNFLQNDISITTDYRCIEIAMIKRVVEINNNPMDFLFGISNTRVQNIFNIEKDFVVQFYALGIIGLILIFLPYFILLAIFIFKTLSNKLKNLNLINIISFITIIFLFGISYFSGNLLNSLSFTIYFTLLFKLMFI